MDSSSEETAIFPGPQRIGRYEIVSELGRGAMGVVYKAVDPNIGRTVAIKTVHLTAAGGSAATEELVKRFQREARAAGVLSHPNIVTIYDAGQEQGVFYIAMEYVEGETLQEIIARGPLMVEFATSIVEDVGAALDLAHSREIIHRDVKPANIMIANGRAKVMDFGVARIASSTATATGTVIGTPSYMSPEAVKGMKIDGRADVFSLGVVLYEMLTGQRPFAGDSIPSVIYHIVGTEPERATTINPQLHNGIDLVLIKALAKAPGERYQTCSELSRDLKNFRLLKPPATAVAAAVSAPASPPTVERTLAPPMVSGTVAMSPATVAVPAPPRPPAAAPAQAPKSKAPLLATMAVLLIALAGGGLWWKSRQVGPVAQAPAATPATPTPAPAATAPGIPAAAPPVVEEHDVMIAANVEGAEIHVDGKTKAAWVTPHRIRLRDGAHQVEVTKDGYKPANKPLKLTAEGPKSLSFTLAALSADVEITSTPRGATVMIDGAEQSTQTPAKYTMAFGEHSVEVRKQGFRPDARTLKVDASTFGVAVQLQRANGKGLAATGPGAGNSQGRVRVLTRPPGSKIMVDMELTNYESPVNFALPVGWHKITVRHKGLQPVSRDVEIKAGQMAEVEINLMEIGRGGRR